MFDPKSRGKAHLKDLRAFIQALEEIGEVQPIDREVDWNLEIGAVIRRSYELRAPAPLFNKIHGIEDGFRVLGAPAGVSSQPDLFLCRIALALGLPAHATGAEIVEAIASARQSEGIKPRVVNSGPCKENILLGDQVNLARLPAPVLHEGDGGRYINTFGCIVAQTPDGSWTNWSIARIMLVDDADHRKMTGIVAPAQHIGIIHKMWADQDKDMPFALALGVEPVIPFVCGMPIPANVDEADLAGVIVGEPIEVTKCETNNLCVPATAEIVLEGVLKRADTTSEGPMGEYAGYNWVGVSSDKPVYEVRAMTFRNDPILPVVVAGEPIEEDHTAWGIPNAAEDLVLLRKAGLPVTMCWMTLEAANHWMVVTIPKNWRELSVIKSSGMFCDRVGEVLFAEHGGSGVVKVLVFEDDVDPTNTDEVVWAFATRAHPGSSEHVFPDEPTGSLSVYLKPDEKRVMRSTKAVYDCLTRDEWTGGHQPRRTSFSRGYSKETQEQVLTHWQAYGYADATKR